MDDAWLACGGIVALPSPDGTVLAQCVSWAERGWEVDWFGSESQSADAGVAGNSGVQSWAMLGWWTTPGWRACGDCGVGRRDRVGQATGMAELDKCRVRVEGGFFALAVTLHGGFVGLEVLVTGQGLVRRHSRPATRGWSLCGRRGYWGHVSIVGLGCVGLGLAF